MNDKFLVLLQQSVKEYKQSWDIPEDFTICIPQHITDRFAELIVKECIMLCEEWIEIDKDLKKQKAGLGLILRLVQNFVLAQLKIILELKNENSNR